MTPYERLDIASKNGMLLVDRGNDTRSSYAATDLAGNIMVTVKLPRWVSAIWWWVAARRIG
jgi:hypothetical protein